MPVPVTVSPNDDYYCCWNLDGLHVEHRICQSDPHDCFGPRAPRKWSTISNLYWAPHCLSTSVSFWVWQSVASRGNFKQTDTLKNTQKHLYGNRTIWSLAWPSKCTPTVKKKKKNNCEVTRPPSGSNPAAVNWSPESVFSTPSEVKES